MISPLCNGSTFDDMRYATDAQNMSVLTRYKQTCILPAYIDGLRNYPELLEISREIFNLDVPPEIQHIYGNI
jgi:hypothetical protein